MPGVDDVLRNLDAWAAQVKAALLDHAEETGRAMEQDAKASAPWKNETGAAKESITGAGWQDGDWIKAGVGIRDPKGPWLELGTGPRGQEATGLPGYSPAKRIYPRRAHYLRWVDREGNVHFSKSVRWFGMAPRRVLVPVRDRHAVAFFEGARRIMGARS